MSPAEDANQEASHELARRVARLLRHEVGDLLQSVYSTTAVLLERLAAPFEQERRLLGDLKGRAELCKLELDAVVNLVCSAAQAPAPIELTSLVSSALAQARQRHPALTIHLDAAPGLVVRADGQGLAAAMNLLLRVCCQSARRQVHVQLRREDSLLLCECRHDGFPAGPEQLAWFDRPFPGTHNAAFGLAVALACRVLAPVGGSVAVVNLEGGGICARLQFPATGA